VKKRSQWEKPSAGLNLNRVHDLVGEDLVEQVAEISRDMNAQVDTVVSATLPGDSRRLRGLPCFAKGVSGVQTDSYVPGSDEHLEDMDAA
jgi:hypothetical protein